MKLAIMGTGRVAQILAAAWAGSGHEIVLGSRNPDAREGLGFRVVSLAAAVESADVIVNATLGSATLATVGTLDAQLFAGKVLIDVANASTESFELVYPNSSLAEHLQAALPDAKVVKTMNTASMAVNTNPSSLAPSSVFLSGDDAQAKLTVASLLKDFGWDEDAIIDLGGIQSARGVEHYFLLFAAIMQKLRGPAFNIRLVGGAEA